MTVSLCVALVVPAVVGVLWPAPLKRSVKMSPTTRALPTVKAALTASAVKSNLPIGMVLSLVTVVAVTAEALTLTFSRSRTAVRLSPVATVSEYSVLFTVTLYW